MPERAIDRLRQPADLPPQSPLVRPLRRVVHLVEPVAGGGEGAGVVDEGYAQVGVVQVQVVRHAPHDDEPHGQLDNLRGRAVADF